MVFRTYLTNNYITYNYIDLFIEIEDSTFLLAKKCLDLNYVGYEEVNNVHTVRDHTGDLKYYIVSICKSI